jgi:nitrite reductase/ring-hydroxylating ferredoxin subunit
MDVPTKIIFCSIEELKQKRMITRWINEWRDEISAVHLDDSLIVLSTVCPHFGGSLSFVSGTRELRCKWHGWNFDLDTGECQTFKIPGCLKHYPFKKINGELEVSLP